MREGGERERESESESECVCFEVFFQFLLCLFVCLGFATPHLP